MPLVAIVCFIWYAAIVTKLCVNHIIITLNFWPIWCLGYRFSRVLHCYISDCIKAKLISFCLCTYIYPWWFIRQSKVLKDNNQYGVAIFRAIAMLCHKCTLFRVRLGSVAPLIISQLSYLGFSAELVCFFLPWPNYYFLVSIFDLD